MLELSTFRTTHTYVYIHTGVYRKNQRGLNGGKDFAPDYLETIYNAIRDDEIIMPDEQEGAAYENYQWAQILSRSEKPMYGSYISANSRSDFDRDVFLIVWKPVIAAVKYIFDTATTDTLVQRAINGFQKSTTLAASYGLSEVVDKMVISLTNFTSLLASDDAAKGYEWATLFLRARTDMQMVGGYGSWVMGYGYGLWFMVYGLGILVYIYGLYILVYGYGLWFIGYGYGSWFMGYGLWDMVSGFWYIVYGFRFDSYASCMDVWE
ncbi:hypothetical protein SARC_11898 [Sphaeroforma arctica JP610]|uniref:Uncharacterized protein n=1 Tax=Sphaeroforma arctica JP610 TaxID=667725 RepID=A0A0L0FHU7_9EUKA|nr:hypothetical protein SARC_11898 [Sphaeroforma arctica JP610]KNC75583.1 hypothetical protein SARC_11898 [Sphaeroforma arctica JP610]|eukprot:XP_014149485.1 hypothetical protein SARC_11898 [Sphaeroforma arctica JP610]